MVRTPRTRYSRPDKDPATIDLEAESVSPGKSAGNATENANQPEPDEMSGDEAHDENPGEAGKPEPAGRQWPGMVIAGFIGGVLALAGVAGMNRAGLLTIGNDGTGAAAEIEALAQEMDRLNADLTKLRESSGGLTARVGEAEAGLVAIRGQIEAAQSAEPGIGVPEDLISRLEALEQRQSSVAADSGSGVSADEFSALRNEAGEARDAVRTALEAARTNAGALEVVRGEIETLASRVEKETARPEIALAIAAVALKSAIDSGLPFTMQLETYASVAPGSPEIDALRALSQSGVPTRAQIAAEAGSAANNIVAVANRTDPEAGYFTRMLSSLRSLVKVRPVGMIEGSTPAAIAARIEVAIAENDYERAISEFETLPEAEQMAGDEFISMVKARLEADGLIDRALAVALRSAG